MISHEEWCEEVNIFKDISHFLNEDKEREHYWVGRLLLLFPIAKIKCLTSVYASLSMNKV